MCFCMNDRETNKGSSSIELLLQVSAFADMRNVSSGFSVAGIGASDSKLSVALYTT